MAWKYTLFVLTFIFVIIASWLPLHGDIHYFSDNARDLLLLHEIVTEKPITLIGPRSGISGVFHGPLWLYINLPAFLLGNGNPVALGWWWWLMYVVNVFVVSVVAQKIFNDKAELVGPLAGLLFASAFFATGWSQFNANGVLFIMPLVFFCMLRYLQNHSFRLAGVLFLLIGLLIQFQIAFGLPMLILIGGLFLFEILRSKQFAHMWAVLLLIPGVSTHILFDVRHDFIQTKSLLSYAGKSHGGAIVQHVIHRSSLALSELTGWLPQWIVSWSDKLPYLLSSLFIGLLLVAYLKLRDSKIRQSILLFAYLYCGFWIVTLSHRGTVWPYYHWGLVPCFFVLLAGIISNLPAIRRTVALSIVCAIVGFTAANWAFSEAPYALAPRTISWSFHKNAVESIYRNAPDKFGYYVFEDDLFGYGPKYAFVYTQKAYPQKKAYLNQKHPTTILYLMPTNSTDLTWASWLQNSVRIESSPTQVDLYPNGVGVYTYELNATELEVPSDPNLLDSLIFR